MRKDLIICMLAAAGLFFLYPVLLGYCSIPVSGFFSPGLLAALFIVPFGILYGYFVRGNKYKILLIILAVLPMFLFLTTGQSDSFPKALFDVVIAGSGFTISAIIGAVGRVPS